MFSFGTCHHSPQSALPFDPVARCSVLKSIFPLMRCVFFLLFRARLIVPSPKLNQIDLRLMTLVHVVQAHFLFLSVFVEGFSNTHTHTLTRIQAQFPCSPLICVCVCVWARLRPLLTSKVVSACTLTTTLFRHEWNPFLTVCVWPLSDHSLNSVCNLCVRLSVP